MTYQLANGRTIRIPEEQFFKMSDQDFKDLEGSTHGFVVNDPFYNSILEDPYDFEDPEIEEIEEIDEEIDLDLDEEE